MSVATLALVVLAGEVIPRASDIPRKVRREESQQRRIGRRTKGSSEDFTELVEEFLYNRLSDDSAISRLLGMSDVLSSLDKKDMPEAADKLRSSSVRKEVPQAKQGLFQATLVQTRVIRALRELLEAARKEFGPLEAARDLSQLIRDQEKLQQSTREIARETLGQERNDLDEEELARLEHLSDAQKQMREDLNDARRDLEELAQETPDLQEAVQEALRAVDEARVPDEMTNAAEDIEENRVQGAQERQARILQALRQAQEALQREEGEPLAELEQAMNELLAMLQREQNVHDMTEELPPNAEAERFDELQQEQADIEQELGELMNDLAQRPHSLQNAHQHMQNAERDLGARQRPEAAHEMQQAIQMMQQSSQEMARQMQQLQAQRAQELAMRMQQMQRPQRTRNPRDYRPGQMSRYAKLNEKRAGDGWDVSMQELAPGESGTAGGEKFPERYARLLRLYYLNTSGTGR